MPKAADLADHHLRGTRVVDPSTMTFRVVTTEDLQIRATDPAEIARVRRLTATARPESTR